MNSCVNMQQITTIFPGVIANDHVDFSLEKGEIRALVGENGAGKSTLMNALYGMVQPASGEIFIRGKKEEIKSPSDAIGLGIGMIHQHFMLVPDLTALENIILGLTPKRNGIFIDYRSARVQVEQLMSTYRLRVPLDSQVRFLSVGDKQRVEILKALYTDVEILILDEPTAILTPQETEVLFDMMKGWASAGKTIVFISHKLREVKAISDTVTIMRQGVVTGNAQNSDISEHDIARLMVGRDVTMVVEKTPSQPKETILQTQALYVDNNRGLPAVENLDLDIKAGEIVGIAGVEGNGQHELIESLTGMWPVKSGRMLFKGKNVTSLSIKERMDYGIVHIPEDRIKTGLCTQMSLWENLMLGRQNDRQFALGRGVAFKFSSVAEFSKEMIEKFRIKIPNHTYPLKTLSGGNQQKVVIAREFSRNPSLLIVSQPTRGVDMGAVEFIHRELITMRDRGCAILLVSADLQELMNISDRLLVMYEGKIVGEYSQPPYDEHEIGYLMAGLNKTGVVS